MLDAINTIRTRIQNGDLDFNDSEIVLIQELPSLAKEYIAQWTKDENLWKKYDFISILLEEYLTIDGLSEKERLILAKNVIFNQAKKSKDVTLENLNPIYNFFNLTGDNADNFYIDLVKNIVSDEYDFNSKSTNGTILKLFIKNDLKNKIAQIKKLDKELVSKEEYEEYLSYCNKNNIQPLFMVVPSEDLIYNLNNFYKIKSQSINDLFHLYNDFYSIFGANQKNEELLIKAIKSLPDSALKKDFKALFYCLRGTNERLYNKVCRLYCSKDIPINLNNIFDSYKDRIEVLDSYIFNNEDLDNDILLDNILFLEDKKYFDRFLETGNLFLLLQPIYKKFIPSHIDEIVEKYKTNLEEQKYLEFKVLEITNYQLAELLAKEGIVKIIELPNKDLNEKDKKIFKDLLTKYGVKPVVRYVDNIPQSLEQLLIECGCISQLIPDMAFNNKELLINRINNNIEGLKKEINTNPSYILRLIINNPDVVMQTKLIDYCIDFPDEVIKRIVDEISNNEDVKTIPREYKESYYNIFGEKIAKLYNLDFNKIEKIKKVLGPGIILYFKDDNIKNILEFDSEELDKILNIFKASPLTMKELEQNYISLREYTFRADCPDDSDIFNNLREAIDRDNTKLETEYTQKLVSVFDEKLYEKLNKKIQLKEMGYNLDNYHKILNIILKKIRIPEKQKKYTDLLYEICNYYVEEKRREFSSVKEMGNELNLNYKPEEKMLKDKIAMYVIKERQNLEEKEIIVSAKKSFIKEGLDGDIFDEVVALLSGIRDAKDISSDVKKNIKKVKATIYQELVKDNKVEYYEQLLMDNGLVNKVYNLEGLEFIDQAEILKHLNIKQIQRIIDDPLLYKQLLDLFQKRKMHLLPETVNKLLNNSGLFYDAELVSKLICYFPEISKEETKKEIHKKMELLKIIEQKITNSSSEELIDKLSKDKLIVNNEIEKLKNGQIPEIRTAAALVDADGFFAISSVYSLVLTPEDAKLIKSNPPKNSATLKLKNNERLKESVELTKLLFTRDEVTVPPLNEIIELENDKRLKVTIGNFTDPCNLTHGERTSSCMRLGGSGEELLYFALKNKNGFHVKISDPKTNKYVSRITGFRNGNTVFLNELRNSLSDNYNDQDLVEALKKFSEKLIEASKDSSYPIENVIASNDYALENEKTVRIPDGNTSDGLGYVYNNIRLGSCVVLATSAQEEQYAMLNGNQENIPIYQPARREKKTIINKRELSSYVNRIESVKAILNGANYQLLTDFYNNEPFNYAIANDEWYIYVDINGVIHKNCLSTDKRAQDEFLEELEKVEKKYDNMKEDEDEWSIK